MMSLIISAFCLSQRQSSWIARQSQTQVWSGSQQKMTLRGATVARRGRGNRTGRVGHLIEEDSSSGA